MTVHLLHLAVYNIFQFGSLPVGRMRNPSPTGTVKCPVCCKYVTAAWMKTHLKSHQGIYRYTCKVCNKGFSSTTRLRGHMAKHTGTGYIECSLCSKVFQYTDSLKHHMITKHPEAVDVEKEQWLK